MVTMVKVAMVKDAMVKVAMVKVAMVKAVMAYFEKVSTAIARLAPLSKKCRSHTERKEGSLPNLGERVVVTMVSWGGDCDNNQGNHGNHGNHCKVGRR